MRWLPLILVSALFAGCQSARMAVEPVDEPLDSAIKRFPASTHFKKAFDEIAKSVPGSSDEIGVSALIAAVEQMAKDQRSGILPSGRRTRLPLGKFPPGKLLALKGPWASYIANMFDMYPKYKMAAFKVARADMWKSAMEAVNTNRTVVVLPGEGPDYTIRTHPQHGYVLEPSRGLAEMDIPGDYDPQVRRWNGYLVRIVDDREVFIKKDGFSGDAWEKVDPARLGVPSEYLESGNYRIHEVVPVEKGAELFVDLSTGPLYESRVINFTGYPSPFSYSRFVDMDLPGEIVADKMGASPQWDDWTEGVARREAGISSMVPDGHAGVLIHGRNGSVWHLDRRVIEAGKDVPRLDLPGFVKSIAAGSVVDPQTQKAYQGVFGVTGDQKVVAFERTAAGGWELAEAKAPLKKAEREAYRARLKAARGKHDIGLASTSQADGVGAYEESKLRATFKSSLLCPVPGYN